MFASLTAAVLLATGSLAQSSPPFCAINRIPPLHQCIAAEISWTDLSPVTLKVLQTPGGNLIDGPFTIASGDTFSWLARFPAGTNVDFVLIDAAGNGTQSSSVPILAGPNLQC
ncbi:uncharacterized protein TRAVEDRAFT_54055 [Trametes versicolor FP-101664 SS1]|uniref:Uncharacterized protein n=1 Tax=Trametes versicolor (strain FP-101664) TaxID=717944 RepID=R7S7W0_TRAVS|nr:uncharacterized protein TRAVEDRAFT_54055 [Trametes versicolor FP-101664 SS1]EIW52076.1 hypothetical protein TRAVEDRAFT_54055 [Trametes versicolor FP-101664 SS1]